MYRPLFRNSATPAASATFVLSFICLTAELDAQPPGGPRGFDPGEIIERLDDNHNGQVDPDEMEGRARGFLEDLARTNNLDLSKPIPNDKLRDMIKARFAQGGGPGGSSSRSSGTSSSAPVAPKAFGVSASSTTTPKVQGFGTGGNATADSWDAIRKNYDRNVVERVEDGMRRYDRNQDGLLDAEELKSGDFRYGNPLDFDKNRDGKVSRSEFAERYKARYASGSYGGGPPGSYGGGPPGGYGYRGPSSSSTPSPTTTSTVSTSSSSGYRPSSSSASSSTPSSSSSGSSSGSGSSSSSGDDRVMRYADGLLKQYDANKSGVLERDEWSKMRGEPQKADRDGNGLITKEELAGQLADYSKGRSGSSGSSGSTSTSSGTSSSYRPASSSGNSYGSPPGSSSASVSRGTVKTYRFLAPIERLPKGLPDWFTRNDANGDGQIAMAEFSSSWDDERAAEFTRWDRNGDGLITPKEAIGQ